MLICRASASLCEACGRREHHYPGDRCGHVSSIACVVAPPLVCRRLRRARLACVWALETRLPSSLDTGPALMLQTRDVRSSTALRVLNESVHSITMSMRLAHNLFNHSYESEFQVLKNQKAIRKKCLNETYAPN